MNLPKELRYSKSHEWARLDGKQVTVGISDYAQKEISDVVFVELPKVGQEVKKGDAVCVVESVKAAFDIYAPVPGCVTAVNSDLESNPALVNGDSYGKGWFFQLEVSGQADWDELMDSDAYESHIKQETK